MKIFLPFKKDINPYLDEILLFSGHEYVYDHYLNYDPSYSLVNIHWPEAIFEWFEPTYEQLEKLKKSIQEWKKKSILVYTKHDTKRNKGTTYLFDKLFELIEENTDVFIHLGKKSLDIYRDKYPAADHKIVRHPLYTNSFPVFEKRQAREKLNIDQDARVIVAPGNIRTFKERRLTLETFKRLRIKKKVLIATNMRTEIRYDFPGRIRLKKILNIRDLVVSRFKNKYKPPLYYFTYSKLNEVDLALRIAAADVVFIPRIEILNSGNVYLGLTFNKILVGPCIGNVEEQLQELGMPLFDPGSIKSAVRGVERGLELARNNYKPAAAILEEYMPVNVAKSLDIIFEKIKK